METKIKHLGIRLNEDEFNKLTEKAELLNIKPASFLKRLVLSIIHGKKTTSTISPVYSTNYDKPTTVNLNEELIKELKSHADSNGWSLSKEIRFRLSASLAEVPAFYPDEVKELRLARNAVDVVGRNLHHIIVRKQLLMINDEGFHEDVIRLTKNIEALQNQVTELTRLSVNRRNLRTRSL